MMAEPVMKYNLYNEGKCTYPCLYNISGCRNWTTDGVCNRHNRHRIVGERRR